MHFVGEILFNWAEARISEATSSTSLRPDNLVEMALKCVHLVFSDRRLLPVVFGVFADAGLRDHADQSAGDEADEHGRKGAGENDCPRVFHSQSTEDGHGEGTHGGRSADQVRDGLHRGQAQRASLIEPGETREISSVGVWGDLSGARKIHAALESESAPTNWIDSISTPASTSL